MAYVLIVDDETDSCEFVSRFLERHGHTIRCVPNGHEALAEIITRRPDFVVLDVRMPGMDGIALLEVVRSYMRFYSLPIAVLTAHATPEQLDRARDLGACRVFHKAGFKLVDLLECIRQNASSATGHGGA
jgi:CheY-like chemotaxis protein